MGLPRFRVDSGKDWRQTQCSKGAPKSPTAWVKGGQEAAEKGCARIIPTGESAAASHELFVCAGGAGGCRRICGHHSRPACRQCCKTAKVSFGCSPARTTFGLRRDRRAAGQRRPVRQSRAFQARVRYQYGDGPNGDLCWRLGSALGGCFWRPSARASPAAQSIIRTGTSVSQRSAKGAAR